MAAQEAANAPDRRIPAVTFRESRLGDVRELARIKVEGMKDDPIMRLGRIISLPLVRVLLFQRYAALKTDEAREALERQMYDCMLSMYKECQLDKDCITEVAICEGRIVGMASWRIKRMGNWLDTRLSTPTRNRPRELTMLEKLAKMQASVCAFISCIVPNYFTKARKLVEEDPEVFARARAMFLKRYATAHEFADIGHLMLVSIGVLPEYCRRGIATALVQRECERSDRDGSQITVAAWNSTGKLFDKLNFKLASIYELEKGGEKERIMQYGAVEDTCRRPTVFE